MRLRLLLTQHFFVVTIFALPVCRLNRESGHWVASQMSFVASGACADDANHYLWPNGACRLPHLVDSCPINFHLPVLRGNDLLWQIIHCSQRMVQAGSNVTFQNVLGRCYIPRKCRIKHGLVFVDRGRAAVG